MLDSYLRPLIDPPLNMGARVLAPYISADTMTLAGFATGVGCFLAISIGAMEAAIYLLLAGRLADGLDGAIARQRTPTDWGGYADIVSDFLTWALLPLGFVVLDAQNAIAAAVLLSSFMMSTVVFLAFAVMAEKRGLKTEAQGSKSFFYLAGLAEGTETIAFFVIVFLWQDIFIPAAFVFSAFVYLSVIGRIGSTYLTLKDEGATSYE